MRSIFFSVVVVMAAFVAAAGPMAEPAGAQPTQEEFLQSLNRSMHHNPMLEGRSAVRLMAVIFAVAGLLILLLVLSHRHQSTAAAPTIAHHPRRLRREILRRVRIDRHDLARLEARTQRDAVSSPFVYLLCPSLMEKKDR